MKFVTVNAQELEKRVGKWDPPPVLWSTEDGQWWLFLGRQLSPELKDGKVVSVIHWSNDNQYETLYPYFVVPKQGSEKSRDDIARMLAFILMQKMTLILNSPGVQGGQQDVVEVSRQSLESLAREYGKIERDGSSTFCRININKVRKSNASRSAS